MSPEESLIFSVVALDHRLKKRGERLLESVGLTIGQFRVLATVRDLGPVCQKDVEKALGISRAGVSGLVDTLVSSSLLVRGRVEADGRLRQLSLTREGEARLEEAEELFRSFDNLIEKKLGAEERRTFLSGIKGLMESLEE